MRPCTNPRARVERAHAALQKSENRKAKAENRDPDRRTPKFFFWIVFWEVQNAEKGDKKWGSKNFYFVVNLNIGRTPFEPKNISHSTRETLHASTQKSSIEETSFTTKFMIKSSLNLNLVENDTTGKRFISNSGKSDSILSQ
jgi:hypothetical protein